MLKRFSTLLAISALAAVSLVACSADGEASDEDFVRSLCEASSDLRTGVEDAVAGAASSTNPNAAVEALSEPIDDFASAFKDLDAPDDWKDWHGQASDEIGAAAKTFRESKDLADLEGFGDSPVPDPPADAKARLRGVAEDIEECTGVTFLRPG